MKKLTAPEKRTIFTLFRGGASRQKLAWAYDVTILEIEAVIRAEAIKRERARK